MEEPNHEFIVIFARPFRIPGFPETLPAGEYEVESDMVSPPDLRDPGGWKESVQIKLHPRVSHPGLARTLTVSLADIDLARAKDKLTGKELADHLLDEMLADPMVRLVMKADGVSEAHLRHLYSGHKVPKQSTARAISARGSRKAREDEAIRAAENEGMPSQPFMGSGLARPK